MLFGACLLLDNHLHKSSSIISFPIYTLLTISEEGCKKASDHLRMFTEQPTGFQQAKPSRCLDKLLANQKALWSLPSLQNHLPPLTIFLQHFVGWGLVYSMATAGMLSS